MPTLKNTRISRQYRLTIYNKNVRELVKLNLHHDEFEDFWADGRDYLIDAENEETAISILHNTMPQKDGFVISQVQTVSPRYFKL